MFYAPKQDRYVMRCHTLPVGDLGMSLRVGDFFAPGPDRPTNEYVVKFFEPYGRVVQVHELVDGVGVSWLNTTT